MLILVCAASDKQQLDSATNVSHDIVEDIMRVLRKIRGGGGGGVRWFGYKPCVTWSSLMPLMLACSKHVLQEDNILD